MSPEEATRLQENVNKGAIKGHGNIVMKPYVKEATVIIHKKKGNGDKTKGEMEFIIKALFPDYKKEYKFCETRRFMFDFYCPEINTGIEYDGVFSDKSRHTGVTGFSKDCEKTNLAQILGYKVLRYTAINISQMGDDLWKLKYGVETKVDVAP